MIGDDEVTDDTWSRRSNPAFIFSHEWHCSSGQDDRLMIWATNRTLSVMTVEDVNENNNSTGVMIEFNSPEEIAEIVTVLQYMQHNLEEQGLQ